MKCPNCRYVYEKEDLSYCVQCGHFVGKTCPHCKNETKPGSMYCGSCGGKLNHTEREKELTDEFAKYLKGTKQTFQYWGYGLMGLLVVIVSSMGFGTYGKFKNLVEEKAIKIAEETMDDMKSSIDVQRSNMRSDKGYVHVRISRLLNSINTKLLGEGEYTIDNYREDIWYWFKKAKERYEDALELDKKNVQAYFELGRLHYSYPQQYGTKYNKDENTTESLVPFDYDKAIENFKKADRHYNLEQREAGWDKEPYYLLGNIYYDRWKISQEDADKTEAIKYFEKALKQYPGELNVKFRFCAENMLAELNGGNECTFTPEQRFVGYIPEE